MFFSSFPLITDELTRGTSISTFSFWAFKQKTPSHAPYTKKERTYTVPSVWEGPMICCIRINDVLCQKKIFLGLLKHKINRVLKIKLQEKKRLCTTTDVTSHRATGNTLMK